jgi:hypothetical protein
MFKEFSELKKTWESFGHTVRVNKKTVSFFTKKYLGKKLLAGKVDKATGKVVDGFWLCNPGHLDIKSETANKTLQKLRHWESSVKFWNWMEEVST